MTKIGLIGEDPNDTESIQNLLLQKLNGKASFLKLLKNKRGHQLNNNRTIAALNIEFSDKKPDFVIFIRDTDALITEKLKTKRVIDWYNDLSQKIKKSILLLNIYELESLIIADIENFNKIYGTTIKNNRDVHYIKEPKEELIRKTRNNKKKYKESDCPDLFKSLNFETIRKNCQLFRNFLVDFEKLTKLKCS